MRRTVVRGAQLADAADGVWQQFAGEVQAPWQKQQQLGPDSVPPAFLDASTAQELLRLPLEAGARCAKVSVDSLLAKLPAARQDAEDRTDARTTKNRWERSLEVVPAGHQVGHLAGKDLAFFFLFEIENDLGETEHAHRDRNELDTVGQLGHIEGKARNA